MVDGYLFDHIYPTVMTTIWHQSVASVGGKNLLDMQTMQWFKANSPLDPFSLSGWAFLNIL